MAIERIGLTTEYKADGLGETKPVLRIGGKTEKFVPNVNMSFQCETGSEKYFINLNRKSVTVDKEVSSLASEKLALTIGNETDIWHIDENGRLKWDIEFKEKPATNKFSWDLSYSEGIEFYYQGELTEFEKGRNAVRPDNVVGSYAVYCNKSGHYTDEDGKTIVNYRTGKLLHIYRPLCIDAKGNKEWAELLIDKGTITVTIPQKYLDTAVYPVTLDPNLGYSTAGGSEAASTVWDSYHDTTDSSGGTMSAIHSYLKNTSGTKYSILSAVYTDDAGNNRPQNQVTAEVTLTCPASTSSMTDISASYSGTVTGSTKYWLAWVGEREDNPYIAYDSADANRECHNGGSGYDLPATWPDAGTNYSYRASLWAVYTAAGGASIPRSNPFSRPFRQSLGRGGF
jgi:hypothetical protein